MPSGTYRRKPTVRIHEPRFRLFCWWRVKLAGGPVIVPVRSGWLSTARVDRGFHAVERYVNEEMWDRKI